MNKLLGSENLGDLDDGESTWAMLYTSGGWPLIEEYSKVVKDPKIKVDPPQQAIERRYWTGAAHAAKSDLELWDLVDKIPILYAYELVKNPHCCEAIIEEMWIGPYVYLNGDSDPYLLVCCAFFNHYQKVRNIFIRRPDLRIHVPPPFRAAIFLRLSLDGIYINDSNDNYPDD